MPYFTVVKGNAVTQRLREMRQATPYRRKPYTLGWLADQMEVDRSLIYRWLTGERPMDPYRRVQMAGVLGIDPDDIIIAPLEDAA